MALSEDSLATVSFSYINDTTNQRDPKGDPWKNINFSTGTLKYFLHQILLNIVSICNCIIPVQLRLPRLFL